MVLTKLNGLNMFEPSKRKKLITGYVSLNPGSCDNPHGATVRTGSVIPGSPAVEDINNKGIRPEK